jgi:hypothetical protein
LDFVGFKAIGVGIFFDQEPLLYFTNHSISGNRFGDGFECHLILHSVLKPINFALLIGGDVKAEAGDSRIV